MIIYPPPLPVQWIPYGFPMSAINQGIKTLPLEGWMYCIEGGAYRKHIQTTSIQNI